MVRLIMAKVKKQFFFLITLITLLLAVLSPFSLAAAKKGKLRISGDNSWVAFVNSEKVAQSDNFTIPSVSELELPKGFAVIAVYVHDAEPAAAGSGGFLADIILDDGTYIGTSDWKGDKKDTWPGWKADKEFNKPIGERKDGWEKIDFNDKKWEEPVEYEQFGGGIWGWGAGDMRRVLKDPDCIAHWIWAGPNNAADDVYFRYTVGAITPVQPGGKLTTAWGKIKEK